MIESILEGLFFVVKKVFESKDEAKLDDFKAEIAKIVAHKFIETHQRVDDVEARINKEVLKLLAQHKQAFHIEGNLIIFHPPSGSKRKEFLTDLMNLTEPQYSPYEEVDEGVAKLIDPLEPPRELSEWEKQSIETLKRIELRRKGLLNRS
jgi:hypothetical protein